MTFEEIESSLPRGFLNAILRRMDIRYDNQELSIEMDVLWPTGTDSNRRRRVKLEISGLLYCVIEPPHPNYFDDALEDGIEEPRISVSAAHSWVGAEKISSSLQELTLPPNAFRARFLVHDFNSYVHLAAVSAYITTTDESQR